MRPTFEFHVARGVRDRCAFDETLFSLTGNVVFVNPAAARRFSARWNAARGGPPLPATHVLAMGLIDEVLHLVAARFREQRDPRAMLDALGWFERRLGPETLDATLLAFAERFPSVAVYRGQLRAADWLAGETGGVPHRALAFEELMMLWLANANPAFRPFGELFDDAPLASDTAYTRLIAGLRDYFETRPRFGPAQQNLVDLLRAPALASPDSLQGQLDYIRRHWEWLVGDLLDRLRVALDVMREEERALWLIAHPPVGPTRFGGDSSAGAIVRYDHGESEPEAFSHDHDWMPRCVMIAKSTYVWLDQLSKTYARSITRLDQIPDPELDRLAGFGITALWFIGLWERSHASMRIKQLAGNPDAAASAYSLHDYVIAADLGGEAAWHDLSQRAGARGIRLASDMVPNHMGLDSRWVIEHPEWFLQLDEPPYPSYTYEGPDLSTHPDVGLWIEDHYWQRTDAAVVFKRLDRRTGAVRYLYHGNDGTSFPWNDTAQLDYLRADVREQVIRTILDVARRFPVIRFDAAMTLAKRHIQRLWYPEPGAGGAIPSRAERGLRRDAFDAAIPKEFWREVVDRVAAEAPGTLLLAEAFWMMEGIFVRTLGMHRVYNSAFMNMLRDEQNANYRSVIKNTLEFDPEILQRYVNFLNNPDEKTAVEQFGRGEKYFGACLLMSTLPGLPMFGHGQFEGFAEKYGMEYRRALLDEPVDAGLLDEHRRRIVPLLRIRHVFSGSREFLLYDAVSDAGHVHEDVFAYSNRAGADGALVLFHNRYADASGWIRVSAAYADKRPDGSRPLRQRTLAEGLALPAGDVLVRCRDVVSGHEHLLRAADLRERGLRFELGAYGSRVLLGWNAVHEDGRPWRALEHELGGRGVHDLDEALAALELRPVHDALRRLLELSGAGPQADSATRRLDRLEKEAANLLAAARAAHAGPWRGDAIDAVHRFRARIAAMGALSDALASLEPRVAGAVALALPTSTDSPAWTSLAAHAWAAAEMLGRAVGGGSDAASQVFDVLRLRGVIAGAAAAQGAEGEEGWRVAARVRAALAHADARDAAAPVPATKPRARKTTTTAAKSPATPKRRKTATTAPPPTPREWLADADVRWLAGVHESDGVAWLRAEDFASLSWFIGLPALLDAIATGDPQAITAAKARLSAWDALAEGASYRYEALRLPPAAAAASAGA